MPMGDTVMYKPQTSSCTRLLLSASRSTFRRPRRCTVRIKLITPSRPRSMRLCSCCSIASLGTAKRHTRPSTTTGISSQTDAMRATSVARGAL
ncbi:hypothetical protein MRB53_041809 [Persea americana]|nr:hypothetical protein MRB53_041809 [Persea americana]